MQPDSDNKGTSAEDLLKKTPKRVIGVGRKMFLRTLNRRIIARLARRASIGIPLLGLYLVQKVLKADLEEASNANNSAGVRNGYRLLASVDSVDLLAQSVMLTGLTSTVFFQCQELADINLPEVMQMADKVSLSAAFTSTLIGSFLELRKNQNLDEKIGVDDDNNHSTL